MLRDLAILHLPGQVRARVTGSTYPVQWQTCLRKILFLHQADVSYQPTALSGSADLYKDVEAYQFLLEVVCGLKSPLLGETEVMGQFRSFSAGFETPVTSWDWFLQQLSADILADAKRVRRDHLQSLGSQSYGGLVRHQLAQISITAILGSGQLAQEILPWITSKTKVRLFYRNRKAAESLLARHPQIKIERLTSAPTLWEQKPSALLIAAPLSAEQIANWKQHQAVGFSKIIDLRGDAVNDPLRASFPVIALPDLFASLGRDRHKLEAAVAAARAKIKHLAERRIREAQIRPFGWEDLCA